MDTLKWSLQTENKPKILLDRPWMWEWIICSDTQKPYFILFFTVWLKWCQMDMKGQMRIASIYFRTYKVHLIELRR